MLRCHSINKHQGIFQKFIVTGSLILFLLLTISVSKAADLSDTTPPVVSIEEVTGINTNLNVVIYKIQAQDNLNNVSLRDCNAGAVPPNCQAGGDFTFFSKSQNPPSNLAPVCTSENLTNRSLVGSLLSTIPQNSSTSDKYKYSSIFYLAVAKAGFSKIPDGCPQWRNDSLQTFVKDRRYSIPTVIDEAGNATEVPIWSALQQSGALPKSSQGICFIGDASNLSRALTRMSNTYESFKARFEASPLFKTYIKNTSTEKYKELLDYSTIYAKFYQDNFELINFNNLPVCKNDFFINTLDLVAISTNLANEYADLSIKFAEFADKENLLKIEEKAKLEAEAKAKAASELKAKLEAEAKAKAAAKMTTITCIKGKLTKKVTGINPKCPAGYKKT